MSSTNTLRNNNVNKLSKNKKNQLLQQVIQFIWNIK